jgi:addiction module HigA family antidote
MVRNGIRPIHPGEILRKEYLIPLGLSVNALAHALRVPATRLHEIVKERRSITADTALRLARYFGGDAQSWLNLQAAYDLKTAERATRARTRKEIAPRAAAPPRGLTSKIG